MASTVWRGHLAFGMVSFPIRLSRAARAEKVSFRRLRRTSPAPAPAAERSAPRGKQPAALPAEEEDTRAPSVELTHNTITAGEQPVTREELVKGYEYGKGQYVVLEDEELERITPATSKEMQIVEFVNLVEIDPIYYETSYYVVPGEAGERPYSLLFEAMRGTGYAGLAQLAMHRREHIVVLRPGRSGLIAHTMFYPDEVRSAEEYRTGSSEINPRELDLAKRLIEAMVTPFEPGKFRDTYREQVQQMISEKIEGQRVARAPEPGRRPPRVVDILEALQESLKSAKKPAATAGSTKKPRTKRAG